MIYGYARCSTNEDKQDITRQIKELKAAGAEEVILSMSMGTRELGRTFIYSWKLQRQEIQSSLWRFRVCPVPHSNFAKS